MCDKYVKDTNGYEDDEGNYFETNDVIYTRDDGSLDYVQQIKVNGYEIGHHTEHPDGTIHNFGIYDDDDNDDDDDNNDDDDDNDEDDDE